jgi:hypothetical protein
MRRILIIAALSACTPQAESPAPVLEAPAAAEELGPSVLCADPTKLVSERGPNGPTVYYCAD